MVRTWSGCGEVRGGQRVVLSACSEPSRVRALSSSSRRRIPGAEGEITHLDVQLQPLIWLEGNTVLLTLATENRPKLTAENFGDG